jgi:hypothetical protein
MRDLKINLLAIAVGCTFSTVAMAEAVTKDQFHAREKGIEAEYKAAKAGCETLAGNTKAICEAEAKGKAHVAKADLKAQYQPSAKHTHGARVARAEADYELAHKRCDDKAGNDKDVCVKEAKAAKVRAEADAKVGLETSKANAKAGEKVADANTKVADANTKAAATKSEVRRDAAAEKRAADYAVAKEKCEVLAGPGKDVCVSDAKSRFGQN